VTSNLYSYSFALNPDWTRAFPPQSEIWDYMRDCVDRFEVGGHLRVGRAVDEARWDDAAERWVVRTAGGEEYRAPVLVWATGPLSEPSVARAGDDASEVRWVRPSELGAIPVTAAVERLVATALLEASARGLVRTATGA